MYLPNLFLFSYCILEHNQIFLDMNNEFCNQQNSHEILTHSDQGNRRAEFFKAYAAVKDMYQVNLSINRVCPLERSIWNQVEKEMAIKFNLNTE